MSILHATEMIMRISVLLPKNENLFSRIDDPYELNDLSGEVSCASELEHWRIEMAQKLKGRPENLSDGEKLKPGSVPVWRDLESL